MGDKLKTIVHRLYLDLSLFCFFLTRITFHLPKDYMQFCDFFSLTFCPTYYTA